MHLSRKQVGKAFDSNRKRDRLQDGFGFRLEPTRRIYVHLEPDLQLLLGLKTADQFTIRFDENHLFQGMHRFTQDKGVTVSFLTPGVDAWFAYLKTQESFRLRTREIFDESGKVRVFVGYDPENYFLECDTFLDVEGNEELLKRLRRPGTP